MKAVVQREYGSPEVLQVEEVDEPEVGADQVLVRIRAAAVNPYDWHMMTGKPWLVRTQAGFRRPKSPVPGADGAGIVEAVGADVTEFTSGDEVWGSFGSAYAEYAVARERHLVRKPAGISFEKAAAVPTAAITALQGLRDKGKLTRGQRVLINGASGGVGTFAVMIAKAMGAHVTAVCSTRNIEMVRSIGADEVIDYTTSDYTKSAEPFDVIFDTVTTKGVRANRRVLTDDGIWVQAGMKKKSSSVRLLLGLLELKIVNLWSSKKMVSFLARITKDDMQTMNGYLEAGDVDPVIDRTFSLKDASEALRHQGEGHARGKSIITP